MSSSSSFRKGIVVFAIIATINPSLPLGAATPMPEEPPTRKVPDVRLDDQQAFHGVVVDGEGRPCPQAAISLTKVGSTGTAHKPMETVTDERGKFDFRDLTGGTYRIETSAGVYLCRLWTHAAAPPSAAPALLVVNDAHIQRGQRPIRDAILADPLLMATVVAAAIAIPIAVHKNRDDSPEGS